MSTVDKLVYMANQIAREFAAQRPGEAVARLGRSEGKPRPATKATEFNKAADHEGDRDLLSDAG